MPQHSDLADWLLPLMQPHCAAMVSLRALTGQSLEYEAHCGLQQGLKDLWQPGLEALLLLMGQPC